MGHHSLYRITSMINKTAHRFSSRACRWMWCFVFVVGWWRLFRCCDRGWWYCVWSVWFDSTSILGRATEGGGGVEREKGDAIATYVYRRRIKSSPRCQTQYSLLGHILGLYWICFTAKVMRCDDVWTRCASGLYRFAVVDLRWTFFYYLLCWNNLFSNWKSTHAIKYIRTRYWGFIWYVNKSEHKWFVWK